jgi:hypothetical protein
MLSAMSIAPEQLKRTAILSLGAFVVLNIAFYFLSESYFGSHHAIVAGAGPMSNYSDEQVTHVRLTFALFSGVIAAFGFAASIWPRTIGFVIPTVLGTGHLVASVWSFARAQPSVLGMTLLVSGLLMDTLAAYSYYRRSRAAWAFLIAMCGVFAVVELFGAPKIRAGLDIGLWTTMIFPGLNVVALGALIALRGEYVERNPVTA